VRVELYYERDSSAEAAGYADWCCLHERDVPPGIETGHALWLDRAGLALLSAGYRKPFRLTPAMLDARSSGYSLLAKACAVGALMPTLFDPFIGFGLDALLLARLGCVVTGIERHPLVWLMVRNFATDLGLPLSASCGDGLQGLRNGTQRWDVVYLDPMFGPRKKRALPNRGLQHLQALSDDFCVDLHECLAAAQARANHRVVLKRRLKDPLTGKPAHQLRGHSVRFDVYL